MNFDINNYINIRNNTKQDNPKLVDNGVKYFFNGVLGECHKFKQQHFNIYYNVSMFVLVIGALGIFLFIRYKGNKSKQELNNKNLKDKQYIMSKLIYYNRQNIDNNQRIKNNMITNLPDYSNHPEASLLHRKIYF